MSELMIPAIVASLLCTLFFLWRLYLWRGMRPWIAVVGIPLLAVCFLGLTKNSLDDFILLKAIITWCGNTWMVIIAFFAGITVVLEIFRLLGKAYFKYARGEALDILPPRRSVPVCLALLALLAGYAVFETQNVRPTYICIQTDKLPPDVNSYRMVFVSDIHLNELNGEKMLGRIADLIKEQDADVLLFGGDIVAYRDMSERGEAAMLLDARPAGGSFGVLGNHEFYNDYGSNLDDFFGNAWIEILRDKGARITRSKSAPGAAFDGIGERTKIFLVGIDDPEGVESHGGGPVNPVEVLSGKPRGYFTVMLKHRPGIVKESVGMFDLQLSGHTHGGQIWPAGYFMSWYYRAPQGKLAKLEGPTGKSWYYCTSGAGTGAMPLRLFTPPEIVVIDLIR